MADWEYQKLIHNISHPPKSVIENEPTHLCFVYFLFDGEFVKIGIADEIIKRISEIQTSNARKISLLAYKAFETRAWALYAEKELHSFFDLFRLNGEWFDIADDERFEWIVRSKCFKSDVYKNARNGNTIECSLSSLYQPKTIDTSEGIKKMMAFYSRSTVA